MSNVSRLALSLATPSRAVVGASNVSFSLAVYMTDDVDEVAPVLVHVDAGANRLGVSMEIMSADPRFDRARLEMPNYGGGVLDLDELRDALNDHLWRFENNALEDAR
jgi:hypothetical protein